MYGVFNVNISQINVPSIDDDCKQCYIKFSTIEAHNLMVVDDIDDIANNNMYNKNNNNEKTQTTTITNRKDNANKNGDTSPTNIESFKIDPYIYIPKQSLVEQPIKLTQILMIIKSN